MSRSPLTPSPVCSRERPASVRSFAHRIVLATAGSAILLGAVACGGGAAPAQDAATPPTSAAMGDSGHAAGHGGHGGGPAPSLFAVQTGPLGVVVTDGSGRLVYRSAADSANPPTSNCTGSCAQAWIPITTEPGQDLELAGVKKDLVGQIQRADGTTQLTLAGWPLYRNKDDDGSLTTSGHHGEDGTWFVVTPAGEPATAS
jgi:predicted lipoprotein with Yx(FWY)xxD motif